MFKVMNIFWFQWVPHSVWDETFNLLDALFKLSALSSRSRILSASLVSCSFFPGLVGRLSHLIWVKMPNLNTTEFLSKIWRERRKKANGCCHQRCSWIAYVVHCCTVPRYFLSRTSVVGVWRMVLAPTGSLTILQRCAAHTYQSAC